MRSLVCSIKSWRQCIFLVNTFHLNMSAVIIKLTLCKMQCRLTKLAANHSKQMMLLSRSISSFCSAGGQGSELTKSQFFLCKVLLMKLAFVNSDPWPPAEQKLEMPCDIIFLK